MGLECGELGEVCGVEIQEDECGTAGMRRKRRKRSDVEWEVLGT